MGKWSIDTKRENDKDTKLLYKNSNNTIFTHSRTCSGVSQLYSRSAVLQIKKNLQETSNYYTDGGKVRRDLSIETDICVLRRYYRNKKFKMSNYDSSAKSRYSTVIDTEVETIEEFPDTSACGDNEQDDIISNPALDIPTLMIENLKELLGQWFQRHLSDKKNKEKIDTVLDILMSQLEHKSNGTSSYSTYILHRNVSKQRVKDKKIDTYSLVTQCRKPKSLHFKTKSSMEMDIIRNKSSSISILFPRNEIRIISTLSIPRSFNRTLMYQKKRKTSLGKLRLNKRDGIILPLNKSNKFINSSSFALLDCSKISYTKHPNHHEHLKTKKTKTIFDPIHKNATNNTSSTTPHEDMKLDDQETSKFNDMPSLIKSLYNDDPANINTSMDNNFHCEIHHHETFSIPNNNAVEISRHRFNINVLKNKGVRNQNSNLKSNDVREPKPPTLTWFMNNSVEFPNVSKPIPACYTNPKHNRKFNSFRIKSMNKAKVIKRRRIRQLTSKYNDIQNKQFTFLYKKVNNNIIQGNDFLKHCRSVFGYFVNYEGNRNIKLDVQVNVLPLYDELKKDASTVTSATVLSIHDVLKKNPQLLYHVEKKDINVPTMTDDNTIHSIQSDPIKDSSSYSSEKNRELYTLLDGAASQSKYIFGTAKNANDFNTINVNRGTITSEFQIAQEICELKSIIKDLVLAAESLVNENIKREFNKLVAGKSVNAKTSISQTSINIFTTNSKWAATSNLENLSKGVQCSNDFVKSQIPSGLKLSKEPKKKDIFEFVNRLAKKSTSYRIIDSESILKVTDMTSNNNELNKDMDADEALTCSLPKSRSLFEMTTKRNKRKVMAFFCDGACGPSTNIYGDGVNDNCYNPGCIVKKMRIVGKTGDGKVEDLSGPLYDGINCMVPASPEIDCEYCSSASSRMEADPEANNSEDRRKGMGFTEGCFYCLLLWIPVIIIVSLFYVYVLKDMVKPKEVVQYINQRKMEKDAWRISFKNEKRQKSPSRYPKMLPSYVVAFAMHETYNGDDSINHKVIDNTQSLQGSINSGNSISTEGSSDSVKTLILGSTEHVVNELNASIVDEEKIDIKFDNECGDMKKSPKISNYCIVENKTVDEQPQVIFNAIKYKKYKQFNNMFTKKKPRKYKQVITLKNVHFKTRNPKNNITKRLYKYYKKAKRNSKNSEQIHKGLYSNSLSKIVSRTRVLKKVSAKVNLLEDSDRASLNEVANFDSESLVSSPSTTMKSFISDTSQNTLIQSSSSSRNDDWYSIHAGNSVIQVSDAKPYKTEIINVAVAVAYKTSHKNTEQPNRVPSVEKLSSNKSEVSNSTIVMPNIELTSQIPSTENIEKSKTNSNITGLKDELSSVETLKNIDRNTSLNTTSDDDAYEFGRTSSQFNNSSIQSDLTLTSNSESILQSVNICPEDFRYEAFTKRNIDQSKSNLLDHVINLTMFPEISPSTSSAVNYDNDMNVLVTENVLTSYDRNSNKKGGDDIVLNVTKGISKNVLKKPCQVENTNTETRKNINLPNEATIKEILKENERLVKLNSNEMGNNYPVNLTEIWDKLIVVLDLAVKRLEETLNEKIIRELKSSLLVLFEQYAQTPSEKGKTILDPENKEAETIYKLGKNTSTKEIFVERELIKTENNGCVQCDIVENNVIDNLIMKLSFNESKSLAEASGAALKKIKSPKIIKNYFEVLKPPVRESAIDIGKTDTATVSTATHYVENEKFYKLRRYKKLISGPSTFIRENVFVITSVPAFMFVLFCCYSMIVLVIKPW